MVDLMQSAMMLPHTTHRRTTTHHLQPNGLTERLSWTLADMLSMYVDVVHKTLYEIVLCVTFAYNTEGTTGLTPFEMVYSRTVTSPLDSMLPIHEGKDNADVDGFIQKAKEARFVTE